MPREAQLKTLEEKYREAIAALQLIYGLVQDEVDKKIEGHKPNWSGAAAQCSEEASYALDMCGEPLVQEDKK